MNCGNPGEVENAVRIGNNFLYGDEVTYTCNDGYYQSSGPVGGVRTCLETGLWSEEQPQCSGRSLSALVPLIWSENVQKFSHTKIVTLCVVYAIRPSY